LQPLVLTKDIIITYFLNLPLRHNGGYVFNNQLNYDNFDDHFYNDDDDHNHCGSDNGGKCL
jgi:hypothetical protein